MAKAIKVSYEFCPKCEPMRYDSERDSVDIGFSKWANSLCAKHGKRLKAVKAMVKEAIAQEREEARCEREGVNQ